MYLKGVLESKISNHNLDLRNHGHGSQSHFCPNPVFELVGVATSAGGIICAFLLLFGLTLTSLDQTKYRNDTAYTYVHNKPVTIWR